MNLRGYRLKKTQREIQSFNILVACEESQAISGEIRRFAAFHNYPLMAYSCDLLPTSAEDSLTQLTGPKYHLRGDAIKMLAYDEECDYEETFISSHDSDDTSLITDRDTLTTVVEDILKQGGWDMIIANPPCTYLAVSGARWYHDTKYKEKSYHPRFPLRKIERAQSIRFLMTIAMAPSKYIVIENPVGTLKTNLTDASYNIGTPPEDYEPPSDFKSKFTKSLSTSTISKRKTFREVARDLNEKKLPSWQLDGKKGLKDLRWSWTNVKLDNTNEQCVSSLKWLIEAPEVLANTQVPKKSKIKQSDESQLSLLDLLEPEESKPDGIEEEPPKFVPLSPYPDMVQPYMFGQEASKKTCFWFKGIKHGLCPTNIVGKGERVVLSSGKSLPKWYSDALTKAKTPEERRTLRSKTFDGISKAVVTQWVLWAAKEEGYVTQEDWEKHQPTELLERIK